MHFIIFPCIIYTSWDKKFFISKVNVVAQLRTHKCQVKGLCLLIDPIPTGLLSQAAESGGSTTKALTVPTPPPELYGHIFSDVFLEV